MPDASTVMGDSSADSPELLSGSKRSSGQILALPILMTLPSEATEGALTPAGLPDPACQPEIATDFLKSALRDQGWTQQSQVAVLVDGADDLRTVVELAIGHKPRTILDWFHISMRLRCIDQIAIALLSRFPAGDFKEKLGLLTRVRWSMWNGQWIRAIERLRDAFRAGRASIEADSAADRQRIVRSQQSAAGVARLSPSQLVAPHELWEGAT